MRINREVVRMKRVQKILVIVVLSLLFLGTAEDPFRVETCEELEKFRNIVREKRKSDKELQLRTRFALSVRKSIYLTLFRESEWRYPENYEELCEKPYLPLDCAEITLYFVDPTGEILRLPFTYFFQERKIGEPYYFNIGVRKGNSPGTDQDFSYGFYQECEEGKVVVKKRENNGFELKEMLGSLGRDGRRWVQRRDTPVPLRVAWGAEMVLREAVDTYTRVYNQPIRSLEQLYGIFPELRKLKNAYTGGYVQAVEVPETVEAEAPSPGNLLVRIPEKENESIYFRAFGETGYPAVYEFGEYWLEPFPFSW